MTLGSVTKCPKFTKIVTGLSERRNLVPRIASLLPEELLLLFDEKVNDCRCTVLIWKIIKFNRFILAVELTDVLCYDTKLLEILQMVCIFNPFYTNVLKKLLYNFWPEKI